VVLADAAYGEVTEFREGLEARQHPYAVRIPSTLAVWTQPPPRHKLQARGEGVPRVFITTAMRGPPRFVRWRERPDGGSKSAGEKAPKAGGSRDSMLAAFNPRTDLTKASHPTRRPGC